MDRYYTVPVTFLSAFVGTFIWRLIHRDDDECDE